MQESKTKGLSKGARVFLKSVAWTLIALSLIAIGYFGAELTLGGL